MSDVKQPSKPLDCYIKNIKCENIAPSNSSWLKRPDAKRADAFPESKKPIADARKQQP
jgi:hypothetical protein